MCSLDSSQGLVARTDIEEADLFLMALESVPRLSEKLQVLGAMAAFRERLHPLQQSQANLLAACECVRQSFEETHSLDRLFALVMSLVYNS